MCGSKGGGGQEVRTPPPPPENSQEYRANFLRNLLGTPSKITKLPSQNSMLGHHRPASGVSLAGRRWPTFSAIFDPLSPHQKFKKKGRNGPPLAKFSGSAHAIAISSSNNKGADQTAGLGVCWSRTFKSSCRVM